jgi:hypothetical protein
MPISLIGIADALEISLQMKTGLAAGLFALVVGIAPVALALTPRPDAPMAIVAWPWQSGAALRIATATGGTIIAASTSGTIAIVRSDDPAFVDRLYAAGASLVLDATPVQACLRTVAGSLRSSENASRESHAQ